MLLFPCIARVTGIQEENNESTMRAQENNGHVEEVLYMNWKSNKMKQFVQPFCQTKGSD